jgi:hypothetical protein
VAAGAALLVLAVVVALNLTETAPRAIDSNLIRALGFDVELAGRSRMCQRAEDIPAGTAGLGFRMGTFGRPGPELGLRITSPGAAPATGRLARGWVEGDAVVPVDTLSAPRDGARVCLRNEGRRRVVVAGQSLAGFEPARVDGRPGTTARVRIVYLRSADESWLQRAGGVADRLAAVRAVAPGGATLWLWLVLMLGVIGAAVALVLREGRR